MKARVLALLSALLLAIGFAAPAAASEFYNTKAIGAGSCAAQIQISGNIGSSDFAMTGSNIKISGPCSFLGMKVRIRTCSGSTSTSAEDGVFNPATNDGPVRVYNFGCPYGYGAGIIGIYVRAAASDGSWTPPQSPSPSYIYFDGATCVPNYCV